jgi:pimeloyl-ACP methyl ester carboxylesterase
MHQDAVPSDRRDGASDEHLGLFVAQHGPATHRAIVLVHGAPDRSAAFRDVLACLGGHHVVIYDRRGYGRSLQASPARTMTDHARDLLALVESCPTPPVVVAHSFGSNPTMLAATLLPGAFAALGLWEPPMPWVEWWPEKTKAYNASVAVSDTPADAIEEIHRRLLGAKTWDRLSPMVCAQRRAEGPAFQTDMASEIAAPFAFPDVVVPALVGYGTETSAEHAYGARWLAENLPNARCHLVPGTGHFAPRTHPRAFADFALCVESLPDLI